MPDPHDPGSPRDAVDDVVDAWARERPDLGLREIAVAGRLGRIGLLLGPAQDAVVARFDLQGGGFDVLATLRRAGEPYTLTASQLARTLLLSRAGMTARVDRLERRGFLERTLDPADRRSFRIRLTDFGFETVDAAMSAHTENVTRLLGVLSAGERDELDGLLRTLLAGLGETLGGER